MFYHYARQLIIASLFAVLIFVFFNQGLSTTWFLYLAIVLLLLVSFVLFGNVWLAFHYLKKGDLVQSEKLLHTTLLPEYLYKGHRAYYFFIKGMIFLQRKQLAEAELDLQKALDLGLRTSNDNAMAALNLAHIAFVEKRYQDAQQRVQLTKSFETKDLMIKENIEKMELALQSRYN